MQVLPSILQRRQPATSGGSTTFSYDTNGNLLSSSAGAAYAYNAKNQTASLQKAGGTAQTQAYAGASSFERIEKADNGVTTQFGESLLGMLIRKEGSSPTHYTRLPNGELISQRTPAGNHYYLQDGLGTIVAMTDDTGTVNARYSYDPYGQVLSESGPYNPWRFKSGYQSQTTDHYKFGHRWYDPNLGRWTQADPLEQPTSPGGWNRYLYAGCDPVNGSDPTGLFEWRPWKWSNRTKRILGGCAAGAGAAAVTMLVYFPAGIAVPVVGPITLGLAAAWACAAGGIAASEPGRLRIPRR